MAGFQDVKIEEAQKMAGKIYQGDCLSTLKTFDSESINCCVTSPPYWALRDYGTAKWEGGNPDCEHKVGRATRSGLTEFQKNNKGSFGDEAIKIGGLCPHCGAKRIDQQLGLESTFEEYINKLCNIFDEVKRVLKKDGTCYVNIGDTYSGSGVGQKDTGKASYEETNFRHVATKTELPNKSLIMIPFRFAIEMVNRGWILRNTIIWHKPNCMPSSIKDRFTVDFEYVFFFVKNKKYWFEQQLEEIKYRSPRWGKNPKYDEAQGGLSKYDGDEHLGKNKRAVWTITTKPFKEAHFATYPPDLIEPMIKAGCPENGIVLDPFFGAGTTGLVAKKLDRNYVGIELNENYIEIAQNRINNFTKQLTMAGVE